MKGKLNIYYDEEGDFLEINVGPYRKGSFKNLGDGIFQRIDEETKEVTGIAISSFKARTKGPSVFELSLPVEVELSP